MTKSIEEMKQAAIQYLRSDIEELSEQHEDAERRAYHYKAQASLGTIMATGLISSDEFNSLGNEIGEANTKASAQVKTAINNMKS